MLVGQHSWALAGLTVHLGCWPSSGLISGVGGLAAFGVAGRLAAFALAPLGAGCFALMKGYEWLAQWLRSPVHEGRFHSLPLLYLVLAGAVQAQQGAPCNPQKLEKCRQLAAERGFSSGENNERTKSREERVCGSLYAGQANLSKR